MFFTTPWDVTYTVQSVHFSLIRNIFIMTMELFKFQFNLEKAILYVQHDQHKALHLLDLFRQQTHKKE